MKGCAETDLAHFGAVDLKRVPLVFVLCIIWSVSWICSAVCGIGSAYSFQRGTSGICSLFASLLGGLWAYTSKCQWSCASQIYARPASTSNRLLWLQCSVKSLWINVDAKEIWLTLLCFLWRHCAVLQKWNRQMCTRSDFHRKCRWELARLAALKRPRPCQDYGIYFLNIWYLLMDVPVNC